MALIEYVDGKREQLTGDQSVLIWKVLTGRLPGTKSQQAFCMKVKGVYLNWRNAPDEYLVENAEILREQVILSWTADRETGEYTRPEPTDGVNWRVSRVIGLLNGSTPSPFVTKINRDYARRKR